MEIFYFEVIVFMMLLLAIVDLMVGVGNDAVNFLSSAVGSKVAPLRTIIIIAAAGIICGAFVSNGMMDIARHGIFRPERFYFRELMCVFLAVMVSDIIILDVFNTLGLPTSTTVSMVFELLGGAFALTLVKIFGTDGLYFGEYLNTDKALSVIMGIFLSVAIAFVFGAAVQWLTRLMFTFDYRRHMKWSAGLFGGAASTAIVYFMIIKGLKNAPFMAAAGLDVWTEAHPWLLTACIFAVLTVVMQVLHWCRVNVLKVVVLLGTFALAMAFAGNDLVNFIGVPLAGLESLSDYAANGGGADNYLMDSLNAPARTPLAYLAAAGLVMILSLFFSKKAGRVIRTSVDLSRKDEGEEMFGSSAAARSIVRIGMSAATFFSRIVPPKAKAWINSRFSDECADRTDGAAFDLVRASVNLLMASLLIALGTSLKLPLSTTYVTFMVAMGTSLADRAWGRESAVFRVTGVLSVIGGWFITAGAAFTLCFFVAIAMYFGGIAAMLLLIALAIVLLVRSNIRYSRRMHAEAESDEPFRRILAERDTNRAWDLLRHYVRDQVTEMLSYTSDTYVALTDGFAGEDRNALHSASKRIEERKMILRRLRRRGLTGMRKIDRSLAMEKNMHFHLCINSCFQLHYVLKRMSDLCGEYVDNNFTPLPARYMQEFLPVRQKVSGLLLETEKIICTGDYGGMERVMAESEDMKGRLNALQSEQMARTQRESGNLNVSLIYLNILQETFEIVSVLRHLLRAGREFQQDG